MKVEFIEEAFYEYQDAIEFYDYQSKGLGKKFSKEFDKTISIIKKYPQSFTQFTQNTRKAVVSIFPYNIIYSIIDEKIIILAVAHQHRKPNYWISR